MADYSKGKIYKIYKKDEPELCYIGSTITTLEARLSGHKRDSKKKPSPFHKKVDGKWDEWDILLIENYPCCSKKELFKREGELIRLLGTLNYEIAGRSQKEYYNENKEKIKLYQQNNKEIIAEKKHLNYI